MKVSVIVPVYNSSKYICQTLNSIINQDFTDYEIMLGEEYGDWVCGFVAE